MLFFSHLLRAARWQILVSPIKSNTNIFSFLISFLIGTLTNFVFPHIGDIARCHILEKLEDVPIQNTVGTVITERAVDSLLLVFFAIAIFTFDPQKFTEILKLLHFNVNSDYSFIVWIIIFIVPLIFFFLFKINPRLLSYVSSLFRQVKSGVLSIFKVRNWKLLFLLNFLIWVLYLSATYLILNAFITTNQITIIVSLAVLIMASTGWAGPTQAAIGTFHFLVSQTLILYGFSANISLALAVSLHLVFTIFDIIWGLMALVILNNKFFILSNKKLFD